MQVSLQNLSGEGGRSPLPTGAGPQAPVWGHAGPPPMVVVPVAVAAAVAAV